jgi:hypothetical protein
MRGRKTGGRQEGTPNKATSTLQERVELEAGEPLPVLLTRIGVKAMREGDHQLAVNAFSKAAVYVYARVPPAGGPPPPPHPRTPVLPPVVIIRELVEGPFSTLP